MKKLIAFVAMLAVALTGCNKDDEAIVDVYTEPDASPTITIKDAVLEGYLTRGDGSAADANRDGKISEDEALTITKIDLTGNSELKSLAGIEYFTNLEELRFGSTNTSFVPPLLSNTKLEVIACNDTPSLAYLDISGCEALTELYADKIEYLYVSGDEQKAMFVDKTTGNVISSDKIEITAISKADFIINGSEEFDFIDLNLKYALMNAPEGYEVNINGDDIISVGEMRAAKMIDVAGTEVAATATLPGVGTTRAAVTQGAGFIESFADLYHCVSLVEFYGDYNPASSLDLSQSPNIETVTANTVSLLLVTEEKEADTAFKEAVVPTLKVETDEATGTVTTATVASPDSEALGIAEVIRKALIATDVDVDVDVDTSGDGKISYTEAAAATSLSMTNNTTLTSAELKASLEFLTSLKSIELINLTDAEFTSVDVSVCKFLEELIFSSCTNVASYTLPTTASTKLSALYITDSKVTDLNVSGYEALKELSLTKTLTSIDISDTPELSKLIYADMDQLKSLTCGNNTSAIAIRAILGNAGAESLTTLTYVGDDTEETDDDYDFTMLNVSKFPNLSSLTIDAIETVYYSQPQNDKGYIADWSINGGENYTATLDEESAMIFADDVFGAAVLAKVEADQDDETKDGIVTPAEAATITSLKLDADSDFTATEIAELKYFTDLTSLTVSGAENFAAEVDFTAPEATTDVEVGNVTYNIYYTDAAIYANLTSLDYSSTLATVKDNAVTSENIETLILSAETTELDITAADALTVLDAEGVKSLKLTQEQETIKNTASDGNVWVLADGCVFDTEISNYDANISFADAEFKAVVIAAYNDINEGDDVTEITFNQAATIKTINVANASKIVSTSEIKYLTGLTILSLSESENLASLDLSSNVGLTKLSLGGSTLTSLDLTSNTELTYISAQGNKSLAELIFAEENKVSDLRINDTAFTALPGNVTSITKLYADIAKLTSLDLSAYSALSYVSVNSNADLTEITGLGSSITELYAKETGITSIDISATQIVGGNTNFATANSLDKIYISEAQNTNIEVDGEQVSVWVQFVKEDGLGSVHTLIDGVDTQIYPDLDGEIIYTNGFAATTADEGVTEITYNGAATIKTLTVSAGTDLADLKYFTSLETLTIGSDVTATSIEFFSTAITTLTIESATIATIENLATLTSLATLDLAATAVSSVDLAANTALTTLTLSDDVTELDITANTSLTDFTAPGVTKLTATAEQVADEAAYTALIEAEKLAEGASVIINGKLTYPEAEIEFSDEEFYSYVTGNSAIDANEDGFVTSNEVAAYAGTISLDDTFTEIPSDLEDFVAITGLEVAATEITTLDVSGFPALETLAAANVTTLKVTDVQSVAETITSWREGISAEGVIVKANDYIVFADTEFGKVAGDVTVETAATTESLSAATDGVTGVTSLAELKYFTALTTLDLSNNAELTEIAIPTTLTSLTLGGCEGIEALDLTACTSLATLAITGAPIATLDISTTAITSESLTTNSVATLTLNATQWEAGESAWTAVSDSIKKIIVDTVQVYPDVATITVAATSSDTSDNDANGVPTTGTLKAAILANSSFSDYATDTTKTYPQIIVTGNINSADFAALRGRFEEIDLSGATVVGSVYYKSPTSAAAALVGTNSIPVGAFSTNVGDDITTLVDKYADAYDETKADTVTKKITLPLSQALTNIGSNAFYNMTALTTVVLPPASVAASTFYVQPSAFYNCTALTTIDNSTSIKSTGYYIFVKCSSLVSVDLSGLTQTALGGTLFSYCTSLKSVTLPAGVITKFNNQVFDYSGMETFTFPASVTQVGTHIFRDTPMTELDIPSTLVTMASSSFTLATNLTKITLNYTEDQIASMSEELTSSIIPKMFPASYLVGGNNKIEVADAATKALYTATDYASTWGAYQYTYDGEPTTDPGVTDTVEIVASSTYTDGTDPSTVDAALIDLLGENYNTTQREKLTVTGKLNEADFEAMNLANFKIIDLSGATVEKCNAGTGVMKNSVPNQAFMNNTTLEEFIAPETILYASNESFSGCTSLKKVTFRPTATTDTVVNIMGSAFKGCTALEEFVYDEYINQLGANVFEGCTSLTTFDLSGLTKPLGASAFSGCTKLAEITSLGAATQIAASVIDGTAITELTIPATAITLTANGLAGAEYLKRVNVSYETVPELGADFFPESFKTGGLGYVFVTSGSVDAYSAWSATYNVINDEADIPSMDLSENFAGADITATDASGNPISSVDGTNASTVTSLTLSGDTYNAADLAADMAAFTSLTSLDVSGCEAIVEVPSTLSKTITSLTLSEAQMENGAETVDGDQGDTEDGRIDYIVVVEDNIMSWAANCASTVSITVDGEAIVTDGVYQLDTAVIFENANLEAWLLTLTKSENSLDVNTGYTNTVIDINGDGYISVAEAASIKSFNASKDVDVADWSDKITDVSELSCFTTLANLTLTSLNSIESVDLTNLSEKLTYFVLESSPTLENLTVVDGRLTTCSLTSSSAITDFSFLKQLSASIVRLKLNSTNATNDDLPTFTSAKMQQIALTADGITELDFSQVTDVSTLTSIVGKNITKLTLSDELLALCTDTEGVVKMTANGSYSPVITGAGSVFTNTTAVYDTAGTLIYGSEPSVNPDFEELKDGYINFSNNAALETALTTAGVTGFTSEHKLLQDDAEAVTSIVYNLTANDATITSVSQLKYFTGLTTLKLQYNTGFSDLDVSDMTSLSTLDVKYCSGITSIDLTNLTSLTSLDLRNTSINAEDIELPLAPDLKTLYLAALKGTTTVESLDLTYYTNLATLYLSGWTISDGELDLSKATSLVTFYATTLKGIETLDLSATAMTSSSLFKLTADDTTCAVRQIIISKAHADSILTAASLSDDSDEADKKSAYETYFTTTVACPPSCVAYSFDSATGVKTTLTGDDAGTTTEIPIDFSQNTVLASYLTSSGVTLTAENTMLASDAAEVKTLDFTYSESAGSLSDADLAYMKYFTGLTKITLDGQSGITTMSNLSECTALEELYFDACTSLTDLDVAANTALKTLQSDTTTAITGITSVSLSSNTNLEIVKLRGLSKLASIDLEANTSINNLDLGNMAALVLEDSVLPGGESGSTVLTTIRFALNPQISELDFSDGLYPNLATFSLTYFSSLTSLDVSGCPALSSVDLQYSSNASLNKLDVSYATKNNPTIKTTAESTYIDTLILSAEQCDAVTDSYAAYAAKFANESTDGIKIWKREGEKLTCVYSDDSSVEVGKVTNLEGGDYKEPVTDFTTNFETATKTAYDADGNTVEVTVDNADTVVSLKIAVEAAGNDSYSNSDLVDDLSFFTSLVKLDISASNGIGEISGLTDTIDTLILSSGQCGDLNGVYDNLAATLSDTVVIYEGSVDGKVVYSKVVIFENETLEAWLQDNYDSYFESNGKLTKVNAATITEISNDGTSSSLTGEIDLTAFTGLETLNMSSCTEVTKLDISTLAKLTTLTIKEWSALSSLTMPESADDVTISSLTISQCPALTTLDISDSNVDYSGMVMASTTSATESDGKSAITILIISDAQNTALAGDYSSLADHFSSAIKIYEEIKQPISLVYSGDTSGTGESVGDGGTI